MWRLLRASSPRIFEQMISEVCMRASRGLSFPSVLTLLPVFGGRLDQARSIGQTWCCKRFAPHCRLRIDRQRAPFEVAFA